jgi:hypothetical protein
VPAERRRIQILEEDMSSKWKVDEGKTWTYSTRAVGMTGGKTYLLLQPYFDEKKVSAAAECTWHTELSDYPDHVVTINPTDDTLKISIGESPGALVNIRNTGGWPFWAWTDY